MIALSILLMVIAGSSLKRGQVGPAASAQQAPPAVDHVKREADQATPVIWVRVPLPITGTVDTSVMQLIDRGLSRQAEQNRDAGRVAPAAETPLLVLEFRKSVPSVGGTAQAGGAVGDNAVEGTADGGNAALGAAGTGESAADAASQFERSLALARYLSSDRLRQVRTVAFVPQSVTGHAVLPLLACMDLIVAPNAEIGDAGVADTFIDPTVRRGYEEIAERRRTLPLPLVMGMLDPALVVYRVRTAEGPRFVLGDELERLQKETVVGEIETVKREGERGRFTGRDLRLRYGLTSHEATDRRSLAAALRVAPESLEHDPSLADGWKPLRVDLRGPLNARQLQWVQRSLADRLRGGDRNLVWLWIDSPGGALVDSLSFSSFLAELPDEVRTVAFVPAEARGDAALVALACDHVVVAERATLGGPGAEAPEVSTLDALRGPLEQIGERQGRPWSWAAALVDARVELFTYTHRASGEQRWMSEVEHGAREDRDQWERGAVVVTAQGISGRQALDGQIARYAAANLEELRQLYHHDGELEVIEPNWAYQFIEGLASPRIAGVLLFLAWFALMVEIMTPNATGAGFIAAVLFLVYFWSQFLHGTAGWLEVLLFVAGVTGVLLEIFVIPGFGIFGLGGGLLIVTSLVLASQTFVIPRNAYQVSQLPASLWTVVAALAGGAAAMVLLRRFLPRSPIFRRMLLAPPVAEELEELERRESLVDWSHLAGCSGTAMTPLVPSGRARFQDEVVDVLSDGELIERGTPVVVVEVMGNRVVVRRADGM